MNRLSTAGFVPPSVYIRFHLFVLAKGRSGQLSTTPWRARGTVGFWATRPVGVLFCPAPPRSAVPPCAAPTRTARGMFGFCTRQVYIGFRLFVLLGGRSSDVSTMPWGCEGRLSPGRTVLSASRAARPCPTVPPCAPTRPTRGMSGFWIRQVYKIINCNICCRKRIGQSPFHTIPKIL